MQRRAEQGRNDWRDHGGVKAIFRWQTGNGGECDALRQHDNGTGQACLKIHPQGVGVDHRQPNQERENPGQPGQGMRQLQRVGCGGVHGDIPFER